MLLGAPCAGPVAAVVIDFDDLPNETTVTDQYLDATFSSDPDFENRTNGCYDLGMSWPSYIMTAETDATFTVPHLVDLTAFTRVPRPSLNYFTSATLLTYEAPPADSRTR